jgi:hypothetical protein
MAKAEKPYITVHTGHRRNAAINTSAQILRALVAGNVRIIAFYPLAFWGELHKM